MRCPAIPGAPASEFSRRLFEAVLSLVLLVTVFEWTQGSEPAAWYESDDTPAWARPSAVAGVAPAWRLKGWCLPTGDPRPADDFRTCSAAVGEFCAPAARPDERTGGNDYCALPVPRHWPRSAPPVAPSEPARTEPSVLVRASADELPGPEPVSAATPPRVADRWERPAGRSLIPVGDAMRVGPSAAWVATVADW